MAEASGLSFSFDGPEALRADLLETFAYERPEREVELLIETPEFSAVCPYSGLPDYGNLQLRYAPSESCIELKSLKYYLVSWRNVGMYQEHIVNRLLDDLVACCDPRWMELVLDYNVRGGLHTVARVIHGDVPKEG